MQPEPPGLEREESHRPRARRTQAERSAETQARVLDAAIDCLVELGYAGTTTTIVAERAGVSRGAQLHHFPTRAALVAAAVERLFAGLRDQYDRTFATLGDGPGRIGAALELFWGIFKEPRFAAVYELIVAARTDPDLLVRMLPVAQEHRDNVVANAERYFPGFAAHPDGPSAFQLVLDAMYGMALERHLVGELPDEAERLAWLTELAARVVD